MRGDRRGSKLTHQHSSRGEERQEGRPPPRPVEWPTYLGGHGQVAQRLHELLTGLDAGGADEDRPALQTAVVCGAWCVHK